MSPFIYLALAIITEVAGTTSLKASEGFSKPIPSVLMVVCYAATFFFMSQSLRQIPLGTVYAIWAGLGTAGTVAIGVLVWKEQLSIWHILGTGLIVAGVVILNFFTKAHA